MTSVAEHKTGECIVLHETPVFANQQLWIQKKKCHVSHMYDFMLSYPCVIASVRMDGIMRVGTGWVEAHLSIQLLRHCVSRTVAM